MKFRHLIFLLPLFSQVILAAPLDDALTAYGSGEYDKAYRLLLPLAENGNAEAQYQLGGLYADGLGVDQNPDQALQWLNRAVENRHRGAAIFLSKMYLSGRGVPLDPREGARYLSIAEQLKTDEDDDEECK